jgi:hypothetical protein
MSTTVSRDALTALVATWRADAGSWEPGIGSGIEMCADELDALIAAPESAPAPRPAPTAVWPGLMAGFTPADTDRTSTNSGDTGGPSLDNPKGRL